MKYFTQLVTRLSTLCGIAAAAMVVISVLVVVQMVWMRYVMVQSTVWQTEFVTYLLIAATFIGSPYVLMLRGHVNVELLPLYVSHKWRLALAMLASSMSMAFCLLIAWTGYELWYEAWDNGWVSDSVWQVRLWIPYASMPFGFGILSLQYLVDIIALIRGDEMPFGIDRNVGAAAYEETLR